MDFDDVLFGLILFGLGLAGACFRCEYLLLRELRATERRQKQAMRELQVESLSSQNNGMPEALRITLSE
jgi:hypothetical protein